MTHIMLPNLQVIFFFVYFIIESFDKIFMCRFIMSYVVIYHTTIILNALDKVVNCMEFRVVEGLSIWL